MVDLQYTLFVILAPFAALVSIALSGYAYRYRKLPSAFHLSLCMAAVAGFLIGNTLELLAVGAELKLFWARSEYIFIASIPIFWLLFVLSYFDKQGWARPLRLWLLAVVPVLTNLIAWLKPEWLWTSYTIQSAGAYSLLQVTHGPWFWVHWIYTYTILLIGAFLVGQSTIRSEKIFRQQSAWIITGTLTPLIMNIVYVFHLIPGLQKDFSSLSFAFGGIAYAMGIFRYQLFDLMPIARTALVDRMVDGVIVLDRLARIVDINPAARQILGITQNQKLGETIQRYLPNWENANQLTLPRGKQHPEIHVPGPDGAGSIYELQHIPLLNSNNLEQGSLVLLHNVTERHTAQESLKLTNAELEERVEIRTHALSQRAAELTALTQVSSALRKTTRLQSMLNILLEETVSVLEADSGLIYLTRQADLEVTAVYNISSIQINETLSSDQALLWNACHEDHPVFLTQIPADAGPILSGMAAAVIMPLQSVQSRLGIFLIRFKEPVIFHEEHRRLITAIAEMGSNAIGRVLLMETMEKLVADRTRDLSTLYDITALTNEAFDLDLILERILDKTLAVFGSRSSLLHLVVEPDNHLALVAQRGFSAEELTQITASPAAESIWSNVFNNNRITIAAGLFSPAGTRRTIDDDTPVYIGVPVHSKGALLGSLCISGESIKKFSQEDLDLLAAIADHIGGAVENAHLRQQAEMTAVNEERQRLARELHDSVTQSLYSLILFSEAGKDLVTQGNLEKAFGYFDRLSDTSQQALREMRLLIYELRPSSLKQDGLVRALKQRIETVEQRSGIEVVFSTDPVVSLPEQVEFVLYRIAQEAMNNILKHAQATRVNIKLNCHSSHVILEIADNGRGFQQAVASFGMGLTNMKERAEELNGSFYIDANPGIGTRISVRIPLAIYYETGK